MFNTSLTKPLGLVGAVVLFSLYTASAGAQLATDLDCAKCVDITDMARDSVGPNKIVDHAVIRSKLARDSVATGKILDLAVTKEKLAPGAVSTAKIEDGAVTTDKIEDAAVTAAKLADGAVTADDIFVRTIVVSPVGTAAENGAALLAVLPIIGNSAGASSRWLIKLEPGIYDVGSTAVDMEPYVDIEGSGQGITVIRGDIDFGDAGDAVVNGSDNAELRYLTVQNVADVSGDDAVALATGSGITATHVTAITGDAPGFNCALLVGNGHTATVRDSVLDGGGTANDDDLCVDTGGIANIVATQLVGPDVDNSGTLHCVAVFDGSFDEIDVVLIDTSGELALVDDTNCGV